jgi:MFS family permease
VIVRAAVFFGTGLIIFAVSKTFVLSMTALLVVGFGAITLVASCNTLLQTIVEEEKRGRVMSFFTMSFIGIAPFGSLLAGALAGYIGPKETLVIGSVCCLIAGIFFLRQLPRLSKLVEPLYINRGIIQR